MKQHKQMMMKVSELKNLEKNARKHSPAQIQQIEESLRRFGFLSPLVIDNKNVVQAGNGRLMAAAKLGITEVPCIQANGLTKDELRAFALVDNRLSETSEWDKDILKLELEELSFMDDLDLSTIGFSAEEIDGLLKTDDFKPDLPEDDKEHEDIYTAKTDSIIYKPKMEKPPLHGDLLDTRKALALLEEIDSAQIEDDKIKRFLIHAAGRFNRFNYALIAEYYCHASPTVQSLFEKLGLVVIDFDKAIENGFTQLSSDFVEALKNAK